MLKQKKGQLTLADAPTVVLMVGLVFLVMATIAFIGEKYQGSFPSDNSKTVYNETITAISNLTTKEVTNANACGFKSFTVQYMTNASNGTNLILASNYTVGTKGTIQLNNFTSDFGGKNVNVSYTFKYAGTACNVTADLQTEVGNNTSIAGIVLTISLVGIVLTVLIGVFLVTRRGAGRV